MAGISGENPKGMSLGSQPILVPSFSSQWAEIQGTIGQLFQIPERPLLWKIGNNPTASQSGRAYITPTSLKTHTILEARTKVKYIGLQNSIVFREVGRLS